MSCLAKGSPKHAAPFDTTKLDARQAAHDRQLLLRVPDNCADADKFRRATQLDSPGPAPKRLDISLLTKLVDHFGEMGVRHLKVLGDLRDRREPPRFGAEINQCAQRI